MPSSHQRSAARVRPSGSEALATSPYLIPVYEGHLLSSGGLAADQLGSLPGCRACAVSPLSHRYLTSAAEHWTSAIAALLSLAMRPRRLAGCLGRTPISGPARAGAPA